MGLIHQQQGPVPAAYFRDGLYVAADPIVGGTYQKYCPAVRLPAESFFHSLGSYRPEQPPVLQIFRLNPYRPGAA